MNRIEASRAARVLAEVGRNAVVEQFSFNTYVVVVDGGELEIASEQQAAEFLGYDADEYYWAGRA